MASRDLQGNISVETTLAPAARTANETGATVDLFDYRAAAIEVIAGTITDGTHSLTVEESDDGTTWGTATRLQGSFNNITSNTNQEVGYIGYKRYIRVNATVSTATTGGTYAVAIVRGRPKYTPV